MRHALPVPRLGRDLEELRFRIIEKSNFHGIIEMSFLSHALLWGSDAYEEHEDVFFCCMPLT
jgi:hypothetical protein